MTYAPARAAVMPQADATTHRNVTKWIVALALFFTFLTFLVALQAFQITSQGTSERTLRRSLAVVSEIDLLLDRHYEDLQQRAESSGPGETLELQDFPVTVPLTPEEVRAQSRDDLRETLLDRGAASLYDNGTGEMRAEASSGDVAVFSVGGSVDRSLNLLRADVHTAMGIVMIVLGVIALLLAALLVAATRGLGRIVALGFVALASSLTLFLFAVFARWSAGAEGGDEYVKAEFLDMAREIMWLPVRNGAILVVLSLLVTAIAVVAARVTDQGREHVIEP